MWNLRALFYKHWVCILVFFFFEYISFYNVFLKNVKIRIYSIINMVYTYSCTERKQLHAIWWYNIFVIVINKLLTTSFRTCPYWTLCYTWLDSPVLAKLDWSIELPISGYELSSNQFVSESLLSNYKKDDWCSLIALCIILKAN